MLKIGRQTFNTNVFLAPLSSCSDLAFRLIARKYGAGFCFFEMLDARSLNYKSDRALRILQTAPQDAPIAAQILGSQPEEMLQAAEIILKMAPVSFIDINAACPAKKVVKKGAGSCFFMQPQSLEKLVSFLSQRLPVPVTVKMRVGLNQVDVAAAKDLAQACQNGGAGAIFVHGRSRSQENYGPVDYAAIAAIKALVQIPVFGSGNILNPLLAKKMFDATGCDGILVAKGSFGNPFIYEEIRQYLATGQWQANMDIAKKLIVLKEHLALFLQIQGARSESRLGELGKICLWYLKGFVQAKRLRGEIFTCQSSGQLLDLINRLQTTL